MKGGAHWEVLGNEATESSADVCQYVCAKGRVKPDDSAATVLPFRPCFFLSVLEKLVFLDVSAFLQRGVIKGTGLRKLPLTLTRLSGVIYALQRKWPSSQRTKPDR